MKKLLFAMALVASFLTSCGDDEFVLDPAAVGTAYYPLELGAFKIFNVEENTYLNNTAESKTYQIRETFNEVFKDQTGKDWYRVEISRRETETDSWRIIGVRTISKDPVNQSSGSLLIKENNRTVVGMVFPVLEGKAWNPNAFNTGYFPNPDDENLREEFSYKNVGKPFEASGTTFLTTTTIVKSDFENVLAESRSYEVVSVNQGPVHRYYKLLNFCNSNSENCDYQADEVYIVDGIERTETMISSGKVDL
ncbi:hypothetical protein [Nibribacter koreensis]|uniref:Lipoprotein n=1 Tax=Nibribacter koreensis TaxID=1084519 RepID=A0ABP8F8N7_9BACT